MAQSVISLKQIFSLCYKELIYVKLCFPGRQCVQRFHIEVTSHRARESFIHSASCILIVTVFWILSPSSGISIVNEYDAQPDETDDQMEQTRSYNKGGQSAEVSNVEVRIVSKLIHVIAADVLWEQQTQ